MSEEKKVVDVTKLEREELEELLLKLSSENKNMAEFITHINNLNKVLEHKLEVLGDRLLKVRQFTRALCGQVGILEDIQGVKTDDISNSL